MNTVLIILNNVIKTTISALIATAIGGGIVFGLGLDDCCVWIGWVIGLCIFWGICPVDTKNWVKNWTRPTVRAGTTTKNDAIYEKVQDLEYELRYLTITLFDIIRPNVLGKEHPKLTDDIFKRALKIWSLKHDKNKTSLLDAMLIAYDEIIKETKATNRKNKSK